MVVAWIVGTIIGIGILSYAIYEVYMSSFNKWFVDYIPTPIGVKVYKEPDSDLEAQEMMVMAFIEKYRAVRSREQIRNSLIEAGVPLRIIEKGIRDWY